MLIWLGILLILAGSACVTVDRRAAHLFYDRINEPFFTFLDRTTHWAKGGYWLTASVVAYLAAQTAMHFAAGNQVLHLVAKASFAYVVCLAAGSCILHVVKRLVARRRPRDELEMGLYGFLPFSFDPQYNSFPSGHALTIMCAAVIAACVWPGLAPLWFLVALWLGLTRAFLTSHFLSDVLVGGGIALIASRITLNLFFAGFAPVWF